MRGFIASGISRTRSIDSRPSFRSAPRTWTWSASAEAPLERARRRCRDGYSPSPRPRLVVPATISRFCWAVMSISSRLEAGDREADAIAVVVELDRGRTAGNSRPPVPPRYSRACRTAGRSRRSSGGTAQSRKHYACSRPPVEQQAERQRRTRPLRPVTGPMSARRQKSGIRRQPIVKICATIASRSAWQRPNPRPIAFA